MLDVRFELTISGSSPADDAISQGISPLGYWYKVNQSPTQTRPTTLVGLHKVWDGMPQLGFGVGGRNSLDFSVGDRK